MVYKDDKRVKPAEVGGKDIMTEIIVTLISIGGSIFISVGGILLNQKLVIYRLEQLEKQVEKHNNLVERMYKIEKSDELQNEKIKVINHRLEDIENAK